MDTIGAIATGMGNAGIGIVRVSGDDALLLVSKIFRTPSGKKKDISEYDSHTVHFGHICGIDNDRIIDDCILLIMKAPKSYTGEDVVEIQCHGGSYVLSRILDEVIGAGVRPAEPGEFTKRAFLNGKMDLSQAEAVMELIDSSNEYARTSAVNQLKGRESILISGVRSKILYNTAFIESALDDPEHYSVDGYGEVLKGEVDIMIRTLDELSRSMENGRIFKEGIRTVIVGKPNVGKSTLLNALSGYEKAIVTNIPGTTRDAIEETVRLGHLTLNLIDTAGIRETSDQVEKIGVDISRKNIDSADMVLCCMDISDKPCEDDRQILGLMEGHKGIVLLNKSDVEGASQRIEEYRELIHKTISDRWPVILISAREQSGFGELENTIKDMFQAKEVGYNNEVVITSARHRKLLADAVKSLYKVLDSIEIGLPEDFYSIDLMDAYEALGKITGDTAGEDLINEIFSKFCTGK